MGQKLSALVGHAEDGGAISREAATIGLLTGQLAVGAAICAELAALRALLTPNPARYSTGPR